MSLNIENNIEMDINASITSAGNLLTIKGGKHTLLPAVPFELTLVKFDINGNVVYREIVNVTAKAGANLTIVRAYEPVPDNDSALILTSVPHDFDEWDKAYMSITAKIAKNLDADIQTRLPKSGGQMTGQLNFAKAPDIASATTTNLATLAGNFAKITGTTPITALGTGTAGQIVNVYFTGILTLTHGAPLVLPTNANIITAVGDTATFICDGGNFWICSQYQRDNGQALDSSINIGALSATPFILSTDEFVLNQSGNKKILGSSLGVVNLDTGSGSDGNVTISSGTTTLARDMYYNNLTLTSPGILNPNGYKIFVKGIFSGNGSIQHNGNVGTAGSAGVYAGGQLAGGAALNTGTTGIKGAGGNAGWAASTSYTVGVSTTPTGTYFIAGAAGNGGTATANSSTANGGTGGLRGLATTLSQNLQSLVSMLSNYPFGNVAYSALSSLNISIGGAGGGCANGYYTSQAGAGGSGGGCAYLSVNTFSFTGSIQVKGGAGGAGATNANSSSGGGGGGTGGLVYIRYLTKTTSYTYDVSGGAAGALPTTATAGAAGRVIENDVIIV